MINLIYLALEKRIMEQVALVKTLDWYYEQYEQTDEDGNLVYVTPAVYLEFGDTDWIQFGAHLQKGLTSVTVHIVNSAGYDASKFRQTEALDDAGMIHSALVRLLYKALQGWSCKFSYLDNFTSDDILLQGLERKMTQYQHSLSPFVVTKMTFAFMIMDWSAMPESVVIAPQVIQPVINAHYEVAQV